MTSPTITGPNGVQLVVVDEDAKVDIRRFCGYPAYGFGTSGFWEMGYFLWQYGQLELRMNALTVSEYSRVTFIINNLKQLEDDLFGMRAAMIVKQAAVFHRNMDEASDRHGEFGWWAAHLVNFLGVKSGPNFEGRRRHGRMLV
jgi:hypothetical protein